MNKKILFFISGTIISTILFFIAYLGFNLLDISISDLKVHHLTIVTETAEKTYDGEPLVSEEWFVQSGILAENHHIVAVMNSSITRPGSTTNDIGITILDSENNDVTERYDITLELGTLTVLPVSLVIRTQTVSKSYDGLPLTSDIWNIIGGGLLANHHIEALMNSSITIPGSVSNEIGILILDEEGNNVSDLYDITYQIGTLSVEPRRITISSGNLEKEYDGTALSEGNPQIISGMLLGNHSLEIVSSSSLLTPGTQENQIGVKILDENNQDVSGYYEITYEYGTLEVQPIVIVIKSEDASKVYDGLPLTNGTWTVISGETLENHELVVSVDAQLTDVGTVTNDIFAYVIDEDGNDVTDCYQFIYDVGELTVLSSSYSSGALSTEGFEPNDSDVFSFLTSQSGFIYFRGNSYGDYNLRGWDASTYDASMFINPLNLASGSLITLGYSSYDIQISYLRQQVPFLIPYFTIDLLSGVNDTYISGDTSSVVQFSFIPYSYKESDNLRDQNLLNSPEAIAYKDYVYDNFLALPESTRSAMLSLASENGIDIDSPTLITDIQNYIQHAAVYNLNFPKIPDDVEDIAIYFLTVSKEGICQHYATAAALMYRAMGIPARYVTGYVGTAVSNQWVTVSGKYAHAWVEIFLDGFGWVPIEVTGGGPSSGGGDGGDDGDGGDSDPSETLTKISVTPTSVREPYADGKTIIASSVMITNFSSFLSQGYTYQVTLDGELSTPGLGSSRVTSLIIYDNTGADVTSQFDITYNEGVLQLYLYVIDFITTGNQKVYDGSPLTCDTWNILGDLAESHSVYDVTFLGTQTNVGISKNKGTISIHDSSGQDVTGLYRINVTYGNLIVTPRIITIESSSASKTYDGTALVSHTYLISSGTLAPNNSISEIVISGSQTSIGKSENTIESVKIVCDGIDVTLNYVINLVEGELAVNPA